MATCSASASRSKPSGWVGGGTAGRGGGTVGSDGCLAALVARLAAAAGGLNRPDEKTGSELELVSATPAASSTAALAAAFVCVGSSAPR